MEYQALTELTALSPLDGRYRAEVAPLSHYLSEFGLLRYRVQVEVKYFLALLALDLPELKGFPSTGRDLLLDVGNQFGTVEAERVKCLEQSTRHDIKAIEQYIGQIFDAHGLGTFRQFVHFGLASQDVTDVALVCSIRDALRNVLLPSIESLVTALKRRAADWREVVMLARTHGQPATPTRLGREMLVFVERFEREIDQLRHMRFLTKFGGATGGLGAHYLAYPGIDWLSFAEDFLRQNFDLDRARYTTQIMPHENLAAAFDGVNRINGIALDLSQDCWLYLMQGYFIQTVEQQAVSSSSMPHKVNPIEFENAEGNLGVSSALLTHFSRRLAVSRLQRDLSDSTLKRNTGLALGHALLAFGRLASAMDNVKVNQQRIQQDLSTNWQVVSEAFQAILRRAGLQDAYEQVRTITHGRQLGAEQLGALVDQLRVDEAVRTELRKVTPLSAAGPHF